LHNSLTGIITMFTGNNDQGLQVGYKLPVPTQKSIYRGFYKDKGSRFS
jgi:hypothetical protein